MYESFFALKEKPFSLTPNPRFLFLSKTHNEVYAHLIYGIEHRAGFVEVTGEVGTGKTTILRTLLSHLDEEKYRVAFIFNPKLTAFELLRNINREFGVADDGENNSDLIHALNTFLLAENEAGRTPILVIDEAQNLSGEVLEQIRLLSNLETEEDKLIQVILVGQPELRRHLSDHSLRQLNQRIAVRYQLRPLNIEETVSYILHRLKIAGRPDSNVFSAAAMKRVFKCSGGVPRRINLICDRALLTAYTEDRGTVTVQDVNQAVAELEGMGEVAAGGKPQAWKVFTIAIVAALAVLAGFLILDPFGTEPPEDLASVAVEPSPAMENSAVDREPPADAERLQPTPAPQPAPADNLVAGFNAFCALWDVPPLDDRISADTLNLEQELTLRGFDILRQTGGMDELQTFNVPFFVPLSGEQGAETLAVLHRLSADSWDVSPAYQGRRTLTSGELDRLVAGPALIPWVDFADIGYVAIPGVRGENVRRLQFLLGLAGCVDIPTNGRYGPQSIACVKSFQRQSNLVVDGLVGPRTLILLYQAAGGYPMPGLQ